MGISTKVCSLIIWCSILSVKNVQSQGYYYKRNQINQYQIVNGKYEIITTTTPAPSVFETLFPWMGTAYDSVKTPEEDAAILNSISDNDAAASNVAPVKAPEGEGFLSWFSIPGFGSTSETTGENSAGAMAGGLPPNHMGFPPPPGPMGAPSPGVMGYPPPGPMMMDFPPPGPMGAPPSNLLGGPTPVGMNMYEAHDTNSLNFDNGQMMPSASQTQGMMMLPPPENQFHMNPSSPSHYPPMQHSPNAIPHEFHNNVNPTFQFHQDVKDSIPIPNPTLPGFSQPPPLLPYAYTASLQYGTKGATNERPLSPSFIDAISSYFNFGKRSDLDSDASDEANSEKKVMESRSSDIPEEFLLPDGQSGLLLKDWASFVEKASDDAESDDESLDSSDEAAAGGDLQENKSSDIKEFPCPKSGIWRWNGEVCIAVGPVPVWACKPNDLMVSGKIAVCRNKIYFSPKVINKNLNLQHHVAI